MITEKTKRRNLFITASLICCLDLFITTIHQKPGFWAGAKSMVNESDKLLRYAMTQIPYGLFFITLVYLGILYLVISKIPLLVSRIISFASILMNTSGFVSWLWIRQPQIYSFIAFIIISALIVLLNFKTRINRIPLIITVFITVTLFISSFVYAFFQMNHNDFSEILRQNDFYEDKSNGEIFGKNIFLSPTFESIDPQDTIDESWPLLKSKKTTLEFSSPIDIKEFISLLRNDHSELTDIEILKEITLRLIEDSDGKYETGKIVFYDYPKEKGDLGINLIGGLESNMLEIDYARSDMYYNIQFAHQDGNNKYKPVRSYYYFDIFLNRNEELYSRYNLCLVDDDSKFISIIMNGKQ